MGATLSGLHKQRAIFLVNTQQISPWPCCTAESSGFGLLLWFDFLKRSHQLGLSSAHTNLHTTSHRQHIAQATTIWVSDFSRSGKLSQRYSNLNLHISSTSGQYTSKFLLAAPVTVKIFSHTVRRNLFLGQFPTLFAQGFSMQIASSQQIYLQKTLTHSDKLYTLQILCLPADPPRLGTQPPTLTTLFEHRALLGLTQALTPANIYQAETIGSDTMTEN